MRWHTDNHTHHTRTHTYTHTHVRPGAGRVPATLPGSEGGGALFPPAGEGARRGREGLAGAAAADAFTWVSPSVSEARRGGRIWRTTSGWFKKKKKIAGERKKKKKNNSAILCSPQAEQHKGLLYLRLSGGWERETESQGARETVPQQR